MAFDAPMISLLKVLLPIFFSTAHPKNEKEQSPIRKSKWGWELGIPNGWKPEPGFHLHFRNRSVGVTIITNTHTHIYIYIHTYIYI